MGRIAPAGPICYLHHEIPFGPAGGGAVGALDQDLGGFAEELGAELALEGQVQVAEGLGAGFLDFWKDLGLHLRGSGAFAGREGEDVHLGEGDLLRQGDCLVEVGVRLTGKADDNISRYRAADSPLM